MILTCEQSYISMFGVIRASGHTTDRVSDHLQGVSLSNTHTSTDTHTNADMCINSQTSEHIQ